MRTRQSTQQLQAPIIQVQHSNDLSSGVELREVINIEKIPCDFHYRKYIDVDEALKQIKECSSDIEIVKYMYQHFTVPSYIAIDSVLWTIVYEKDRVMHIEKRNGVDMITYRYDGDEDVDPVIVRVKRY